MFHFTNEQKDDWDQFSHSSSSKYLNFSSFLLEDETAKEEENFDFPFNKKKEINNLKSEPSNQKNLSDKNLGIEKNTFFINDKDKKKYFALCKPRGRKTTRPKKSIHDKYVKDNLIRKIKVHSINFILNLVNFVLNTLGKSIKFRIISYTFKKGVKNDEILSFKKMTVKGILCQQLSSKIKKDKDKDNTIIFETIKKELKEEPIIKNLLEKKYLEVFKNLYYNNKAKIINLKDYGSDFDPIINIPKNIEIFEDLVRKNKNDYSYITKLKESVDNYFLNEEKFKIIEEK